MSGVDLRALPFEQDQFGAPGEEARSAGLIDLDMRVLMAEDRRDRAGTAPPARGNWRRFRSSPRTRAPRSRTDRRRRRRAAGSIRHRHRRCRAGSRLRSPRYLGVRGRGIVGEEAHGRRMTAVAVGVNRRPSSRLHVGRASLRLAAPEDSRAVRRPAASRSSCLPVTRDPRWVDRARRCPVIGAPLRTKCCRSSVVERILGKAEVVSSILTGSTIISSGLSPAPWVERLSAVRGPQPGLVTRAGRKSFACLNPQFRHRRAKP